MTKRAGMWFEEFVNVWGPPHGGFEVLGNSEARKPGNNKVQESEFLSLGRLVSWFCVDS